ncbi:hypothetical protein [Streptomyces lancefieldiae]|uniref:Uncharacterized protein n=1 Tax=Streptomyces lancefieldiae TaxID=3075520 RepID=A0ABU3AJ71_9ACTN|nr:hypothetical protein [Streptomyces sp. DSM 40712]MDT0610239.1 hypothetical protein [Streptomyces sp. DSM 40712]
MASSSDDRTAVDTEFPEVEVRVSPVTDRARATFAKTHARPGVPDFAKLFADSEK